MQAVFSDPTIALVTGGKERSSLGEASPRLRKVPDPDNGRVSLSERSNQLFKRDNVFYRQK
jgi:hypothetical protein